MLPFRYVKKDSFPTLFSWDYANATSASTTHITIEDALVGRYIGKNNVPTTITTRLLLTTPSLAMIQLYRWYAGIFGYKECSFSITSTVSCMRFGK